MKYTFVAVKLIKLKRLNQRCDLQLLCIFSCVGNRTNCFRLL